MSCENYCPEIHNASDTEDSDYSVESLPDSDDVDNTPMEVSNTKMEKAKKVINNMIKEEVKKVIGEEGSFLKSKDFKKLNEMTEEEKSKLSDLEKINLVGKTIWRSGGISVDNIIEIKQIIILISATSQIDGFKEFPRDHCLKCLEMIIYHANKHLESLDI
jgi:hypothetical protein